MNDPIKLSCGFGMKKTFFWKKKNQKHQIIYILEEYKPRGY